MVMGRGRGARLLISDSSLPTVPGERLWCIALVFLVSLWETTINSKEGKRNIKNYFCSTGVHMIASSERGVTSWHSISDLTFWLHVMTIIQLFCKGIRFWAALPVEDVKCHGTLDWHSWKWRLYYLTPPFHKLNHAMEMQWPTSSFIAKHCTHPSSGVPLYATYFPGYRTQQYWWYANQEMHLSQVCLFVFFFDLPVLHYTWKGFLVNSYIAF